MEAVIISLEQSMEQLLIKDSATLLLILSMVSSETNVIKHTLLDIIISVVRIVMPLT